MRATPSTAQLQLLIIALAKYHAEISKTHSYICQPSKLAYVMSAVTVYYTFKRHGNL